MGIMNIIEELFNDLDDQRFQQLQKLTENIIVFRVIKQEDVRRDIFLEKLYDYIDIVNRENNINTRKMEYLTIYAKSLLSLVDKGIEKNSREEKYLLRAKEIEKGLRVKDSDKVELLKDITRYAFSNIQVYNSTNNETIQVIKWSSSGFRYINDSGNIDSNGYTVIHYYINGEPTTY